MKVEHPTAPSFVLVRPQMGENIGAAARAMLNFGLDHMRIVAPRDGWPNPAAVAMASGAGRVVDAARLDEQEKPLVVLVLGELRVQDDERGVQHRDQRRRLRVAAGRRRAVREAGR